MSKPISGYPLPLMALLGHVILDYDKDGNIVGIEILNVSKRMENPRALE